MASSSVNPLSRLAVVLRDEKKEITAIYLYAILGGLIQLSLPLGIQSIIGYVLGGAMSTSLVILIIVVVLGVVLNGVLQMSQMKVSERIQQKIFFRYSFAFTNHLPQLNLQHTDGYYLPELVNRFFDVPTFQKSLSKILLDFPLAITQILLGLLLLAFYHPAFIAFGILLLLVLVAIFWVTGNRGFQTSLAKSNYKYAVAAWLEEMARVIKQFKFSEHTGLHSRRADEKVVKYLDARTDHFKILLLQYKTLIAFKVLITAAMLIVGSFLLLDQQINIGQFVAAEIVILIVINSVEKLIVSLDTVYSALTALEKINKLMDKPKEENGSFGMSSGPVSVEFSNVSFGYNEHKRILTNISFKVTAGSKVALSGPNGSGKSTVLKLLTGAYPRFTGAVLINGVPIGNYNLQTLRSHTGILLGDQDIFQGTIWENLTMGDPKVERDHVLWLCKETGLDAFIAAQPDGFDAELDAAGTRLPRSIVQEILLVRALAGRPCLLLLEDPLSGLETEKRQRVAKLLLGLQNVTIIAATNDADFTGGCTEQIHLPVPVIDLKKLTA